MTQTALVEAFAAATTPTLKLFTPETVTDTVVQTSTTVTEQTNRVGYYAFTDIAESHVGEFGYLVLDGSVKKASGYIHLSGEANSIHEGQYERIASRTVTITTAQATAALSGSTISWRRGDDNTVQITGLGDLSGWTKLWFTAKGHRSDADEDAWVHMSLVSSTTTLERLYGVAGTGSEAGVISIDSEPNGIVDVTLNYAASESLRDGTGVWGFKILNATVRETRAEGVFNSNHGVVRATS